MVQLPPGLREVIGTDGPDEFRGRPQTAFFGRAGSDLFRAAGLEGVQFFLGGSNADRYVAPSGTYVVIGETAGANDVLRAPGVSLNGPNTGIAEVDGRHLVVVDIGSDTVVWLLDWLDPARQVETFELGDGTFRFGDEITAASIRASANYEAFSMRDLFGDDAAAVRATFDALLARADELEGDLATPGPDVLTGTPGDDRIEGLAGDDVLRGAAGDDLLLGGSGDDDLGGGAGNDVLDGGTGADRMAGGAGDDTFVVDEPGDQVVEQADGGRDLVASSIDFVLPDEVEELLLIGDAAVGSGNALANLIIGNAADNRLSGETGADQLEGRDGADLLRGGNGGDTLSGGAGGDLLLGGQGEDSLLGNRGPDRLDGKGGSDELSGGRGPDVLVQRARRRAGSGA
jgi:Ca2+-binding RTX toxin-like protein